VSGKLNTLQVNIAAENNLWSKACSQTKHDPSLCRHYKNMSRNMENNWMEQIMASYLSVKMTKINTIDVL
jgi:hypothetical protein